jgi:hypothetical protein
MEEAVERLLGALEPKIAALARQLYEQVLAVFPAAVVTTDSENIGFGTGTGYKGLIFTIAPHKPHRCVGQPRQILTAEVVRPRLVTALRLAAGRTSPWYPSCSGTARSRSRRTRTRTCSKGWVGAERGVALVPRASRGTPTPVGHPGHPGAPPGY